MRRSSLALCIGALLFTASSASGQERPPFYRVLDSWGQGDLAAAERFMLQVKPGVPARTAAEGVVLAMKGEFTLAQTKLEAVQDKVGDYLLINEIHALCAAMRGQFDRAREILGPDDDGVRPVRMAVEGPFRAKYPLLAPLLEHVTPSGRYRIVSDVGLPRSLEKLEAELQAAAPTERKALGDKIHRQHQTLLQLGDVMDKAFTNFDRMFGELRGIDGVSTVYVFAEREQFEAFRAAFRLQSEHVVGSYFPIARILVFYERGNGKDLVASNLKIQAKTLKTLLHEGFHQYLHLCVDRAPPWLNEGLAEYFGIRLADQIQLQRNPDTPPRYPDRLKEIVFLREKASGLAPALPLHELMAQDQGAFMAPPERAFTNYAQSWVFVHFLASTPAGRGHLLGYLRGFKEGESVLNLNGKLLGLPQQRAKLEKGWRRHAGKLHKRNLERDPSMVEWFAKQREKLKSDRR